jgi:hypothetical protein
MYYIDRDIRDTTVGSVPYNESLVGSKNYESLEDLLGSNEPADLHRARREVY